MSSMGNKSFVLNTGQALPAIGFGTFCIQGKEKIFSVLDEALSAGYRLIDTAAVYGNEEDIGESLQALLPRYGLKRSDIFITSKLSPGAQGGGKKTEEAARRSLRNLRTNYLDLYLIHWPGSSGITIDDPKNKILRANSWSTLVELKEKGQLRAIGVSNYTIKHLEELLSQNSAVPAVNQVEWHPHYYQPSLLEYCNRHGIVLQAYSSLGGSHQRTLINDPTIEEISNKLHRSKAQILLKWALQQEVAVIPKASTRNHIFGNIDLDFEIPPEEMNVINNLRSKNHKYAWDPSEVM